MANESLLATLNQALNKYALERGRIFGRIQERRDALFDAETVLKRVEEMERQAIWADDELTRKMRELTDHYNSLPSPRPQALLEQQNDMGRQRVETNRRRMESHGSVQAATEGVEKRKIEVAVADQDLKTIDTRIQETTTEIQRLSRP